MHPKLKAAVEFVEQGGGQAIIAGLHQAPAALDGLAGTTVKPSTRLRCAPPRGRRPASLPQPFPFRRRAPAL